MPNSLEDKAKEQEERERILEHMQNCLDSYNALPNEEKEKMSYRKW